MAVHTTVLDHVGEPLVQRTEHPPRYFHFAYNHKNTPLFHTTSRKRALCSPLLETLRQYVSNLFIARRIIRTPIAWRTFAVARFRKRLLSVRKFDPFTRLAFLHNKFGLVTIPLYPYIVSCQICLHISLSLSISTNGTAYPPEVLLQNFGLRLLGDVPVLLPQCTAALSSPV